MNTIDTLNIFTVLFSSSSIYGKGCFCIYVITKVLKVRRVGKNPVYLYIRSGVRCHVSITFAVIFNIPTAVKISVGISFLTIKQMLNFFFKLAIVT